jgi:enolase
VKVIPPSVGISSVLHVGSTTVRYKWIIRDARIFNCGLNQVNKIRTIVTESIEAAKMAEQADWGVMTSHHRSVDQLNVLITGLN